MIKRILLFCFTILSISLFAQSDDCGTIIDLGEGPSCDMTVYNNINATPSQIFDPPSNANIPSCWDNVNNDVWFEFMVPANGSIVDFTIVLEGDDVNGTGMTQPQLAIYRGECALNELDELLCAKAEVGESILEMDLLGLTPGIPYFLRVDAFSATATPNWGDFQLCVDTLHQVNTIDEGGSNSCSGELYDTGGPDGDYSNNENNVFSICPPFPNNECITYTLEYYNIEAGGFFTPADVINIYDGDGVGGTPIATIDGAGSTGDSDGGVCFTAQASSGCLTVEFISDGTGVFEGFASSWVCSTQACEPLVGLQVNGTITDDEIIDIVSAPETVVTVDTIICSEGAYGTFTADNTDLGLGKGLLLTSGTVQNAVGPNTGGGTTGANGTPGDDDLDYISVTYGDGQLSNDACIVELDVYAASDELAFEYVFGSEEYPEFVNSFNDIFAFLISGPGIVGDPGLNNQLNIATLPNSTTLVEINSVNNLVNWEYYRNNLGGQSIEYDGLTSDFLGVKKSLTARADVIPCNTYHLKLAIADRGDAAFDSGVFVSEITGGRPQSSLLSQVGLDYLIEDCSGTEELVTFLINETQDDTTQFVVNISGTAEFGIDYILTGLSDGDMITILPGQTQVSFPILPVVDNIAETTETIIFTLTNNFGCGEIVYFERVIDLEDNPVVEINLNDTAFVCLNGGISLEVTGATSYFWTPVSVFPNSNPSSPTPFAEPTVDGWLNVIGQVGICTDEDSIYLQIIDPQISINPLTPTDICEGTSISLQAVNNVNNQGLVWTPMLPDTAIITDTPPVTTTYTAIVELEGCVDSASITVNVDAFDFPVLTTMDTTLCESYTFDAAAPIPVTTTTYDWTPNMNMNDNTLPNPTITANGGTVLYTLVATSENGYCSQTATVNVVGLPANANINNPDTIQICLGESVNLSANTSTEGVGFQWISNPIDPTLNPVTDTIITVTPTVSTTYHTELIVGVCEVYDSIFVRVDSMPDLSLEPIPFKEIYCAGDIVSIVTPTYQPAHFPVIMHQWNPATSIDSDLENLNLVLIMDETTTYTRITSNRGCIDTMLITLEVVDPVLALTWTDTTICAGDLVIAEELNGEDNFMWSPEVLSGGDTNMPTLSPSQTTTYTVSATISDCPAETNLTVNVVDAPVVTIAADPATDIVQGQDIEFTANVLSGGSANDVFSWTYNNGTPATGNPIHFIMIESDNNIAVTVTNESGCEGNAELYIPATIPTYRTPNAFTPDGDGVNDFFNLTYLNQVGNNLGPIQIERFAVWNRWGNLVYDNDTPATGWDGTYKGNPAPSDVYVYLIQIKLPNGSIQTIKSENGKSDITLIR